ncbi:Chloramphenicol acetyltransferase-like domain-containing protein [Artemisia annua]|uniref:Chloramphenicol acetyltransferase-like domain-containing protein n=1 Tax=Artemisia annua TaxID=35608 RepID=A0A2U1MKM1_ARTAN|nr:Chloramphenicol acetyltransferase-like domain-containing protein [Artemisia annua]
MAWTSIARSGTDESFLAKGDFPLYDRESSGPAVPSNYFGNCLAKTSVLVEKDGFVTAAKLLGDCLHKKLNDKDGILKDAATWCNFSFKEYREYNRQSCAKHPCKQCNSAKHS